MLLSGTNEINTRVRIEQLAAHWAHAPEVVSSSLTPNKNLVINLLAIITQLVRVLGCDSKRHGFKSRYSP